MHHMSVTLGGICEEYMTFSDGVKKTLNTGVVTLLNYGERVPSIVTGLTFAHQASWTQLWIPCRSSSQAFHT